MTRRDVIAFAAEALGLDPETLMPVLDPVELQDADIKITPLQRAYLAVFDERVREWRRYDTDALMRRRYRVAFALMMAGSYPLEEAA